MSSNYTTLFAARPEYASDGFDFPVGPPDAVGFYDAQPFGVNDHSGEDWNGVRGGDSDLGEPIYAMANGWVSEAEDQGGGWCNVMRIVHLVDGVFFESIYAHNETMYKTAGDWVRRGERIASIGKCSNYFAHLHLELRSLPDLPLGNGYSSDSQGLVPPTPFIQKNRPLR